MKTKPPSVAAIVDAAERGWTKWARETLVHLGDQSALKDEAGELDGPQPQRAINATVALGPERFGALRDRFFTKSALSGRSGRSRAASILHGVMTRVMIHRDARWKKDRDFVALVDGLANEGGDALGFGAASLALVLRGKDPLVRPGSD